MFFHKNRTFIVAEIGNNHEGSFSTAKKLINKASNAGVDAVKFQTFIPELYSHPLDFKRQKTLKNFQLSFNEFIELKKYSNKKNLYFISTPFDLISAKFLCKNSDAIKISSGDNNFYPLIETCIKSKKKIIISTGLLIFDEIIKLINKIESKYGSTLVNNKIKLLHCVTGYPVKDEYANLRMIEKLKIRFKNIQVGYSDHTLGNEACLAAVTLGAKIIEKHFTLSKTFSDFRDHKLSADPLQLKKLVCGIRKIEKMLGKVNKGLAKIEKLDMKLYRRQPYASKNLNKDNILSINDINFLRPLKKVSFKDPCYFIGKRIKKNIKKDSLIKKSDIFK